MNFPQEPAISTPADTTNKNKEEKKEEKVEVPIDVALAFQTMIMTKFFKNNDGSDFVLSDTTMWEWSDNYGKAFRDFCDAHPIIAGHINTGHVFLNEEKQTFVYTRDSSIPEDKRLTDKEIQELVTYVKANSKKKIEVEQTSEIELAVN